MTRSSCVITSNTRFQVNCAGPTSPGYQVKADTLGWWDLRNLPEGDYTLRVRLEKTNGFTAEDRVRFVRDTTPANIEILRAAQIWDNHERKVFVVFRSDDQGVHQLHYRPQGSSSAYSIIPFDRGISPEVYFGHIGLYAYRVGFIEIFSRLEPCELEEAESLEQLRVLYNGYSIHSEIAREVPGPGIDTEADLVRAERLMETKAP